MPTAEQHIQAIDRLRAAFGLFADVRQHLTIWEFQGAIAEHIRELGGQGFVASVGEAIVAGARRDKRTHEP